MNDRLSLQDLIDLLAKKQDVTKKDAEAFLRELIALISETIEQNEPVKIKDFGTFKLTKINARKSVDVNTGEAIEIAAHYKLSFVPDKVLREAVNRPFSHFESVILEEGVSFDNIESRTEEIVVEEVEETEAEDSDNVEADETEAPVVESSLSESLSIEDRIATILNSNTNTTETEQDVPDQTQYNTIEYPDIQDPIIEESAVESVVDGDEKEQESEVEIIESINETLGPIHESGSEEEYRSADYGDYEYKEPLSRRIPQWVIPVGALLILAVVAGVLFRSQIMAYLHDIREDVTLSNKQQEALANVHQETYIVSPDSANADSTAVIIKDTVSSTAVTAVVGSQTASSTVVAEKDKPVSYKYQTATIEQGMTLRMLGLEHYGNKSFWVYIYQENKNKISNPNNVPLGTVLSIAPKEKYGIDSKSPESVKKARQIEEQIFKEFE